MNMTLLIRYKGCEGRPVREFHSDLKNIEERPIVDGDITEDPLLRLDSIRTEDADSACPPGDPRTAHRVETWLTPYPGYLGTFLVYAWLRADQARRFPLLS